MYDGFEDDLRRAAEGGEGAVAKFIHETAKARGVSSWDVFEASARARLGWSQPDPPRRSSRRRRPRRRGMSARHIASGLLRQLWPQRRRRRSLARQLAGTALGLAGRQLRRTGGRLIHASWRVARREFRRSRQQVARLARRQVAEFGVFAWALGFALVERRWPTRQELRRSAPRGAAPAPQQQQRPIPEPSPAVAAMLNDGYTFREATYLFGAQDPQLRDPADDWPGALSDFHQALRGYVRELRQYAEAEPAAPKPAKKRS